MFHPSPRGRSEEVASSLLGLGEVPQDKATRSDAAAQSPGDEMIKRIVTCFRDLQGNRSYSPRFELFRSRLARAREEISDRLLPLAQEGETVNYVEKWKSRNETEKSRLERLKIWESEGGGTGHRYSPHLFARNPFSFTNPLSLDNYLKLYPGQPNLKRLRLVDMVVTQQWREHRGENFAVVGAHRTGKTTILNLVQERLDKEEGRSGCIPVRINASVTPPHTIFTAIMSKLSDREPFAVNLRAALREPRSKLMDFARATAIRVGDLEFSVAAAQRDVPEDHDLESLLARVGGDRPEWLAEFLKLSLQALQDALNAIGIWLLIIVDELSDVILWGGPQVFAVWRHAIESSEFSKLKWLISTSRPIVETAKYSPITNVLRELTVGPLDETEAEILIDAFSTTAWRDELKGVRTDEEHKLRPVITLPARTFLMSVTSRLPYLLQVACFHIYERATRSELPLINKALCRKVILSRVLPELSDYLEHQWAQISVEAQRFVMESLRGPALPPDCRDPDKFLQNPAAWRVDLGAMPPGARKALERSGLRGEEDGFCAAPLVATWLLAAGEVGPPKLAVSDPVVP